MSIKLTVYDKHDKLESEMELDSSNKKNLLDQALDNKSQILFGCFGGSCGTCKCKILKGKELIDKEGIRPLIYGDIKEDDFLPCIATFDEKAKDGEIEIKRYV